MLSFDIENELDNVDPSTTHIIKKLFYFFNKSSVEGKFVKPFMIKFFLEGVDQKDIKWSLDDIYTHLNHIPKYQLATNMLSDYNFVDINGKIFPIKNQDSIKTLLPYESSAYDFEVNFGSVIVDDTVIDTLQQLLTQYEIYYEIDEDENNRKTSMILYPSTSKYQLRISLDGKIDKNNKYEVSPRIEKYNNDSVISLGKFDIFENKPTPIPNEDNLAVISRCSKCNQNIICNYWSYKGTKCPHCFNNVKV